MGECRHGLLILFAVAAAAIGCEKRIASVDDGPLSFEVRIVDGGIGSEEEPLPFSHAPFALTVDVDAIGRDGAPDTAFAGTLHLKIEPRGKLAEDQAEWLEMTGGVARGVPVRLYDVHNVANVWVEHTGTDDSPGNYATGLSQEIRAVNPTIRNVQEVTPDPVLQTWLTSALAGEFVIVDLEGRTVVVTGVTNDGCYVTDTTEPGLSYASIYVYNFSRPEVEVGDRLGSLSGTNDEFFGFTELSFPSWKADGTAEVPAPVVIDAANVDDSDTLEMYESALVEVQDAVVCPLGEGFYTYGQWAVLVDPAADCGGGDGKINVVSAFTAADFDPEEHVGETLPLVRGNLRFHSSADPSWMIYVRSEEDIAAAGAD
ncbi:MAG: hypothetical protein M0R80_12135 [Proteobacteria bacterium]|jgi:hypothetical protein|nr:hypothetical protein [Pseudomonadota bacterium]